MNVTLTLFAVLREILGAREIAVELPEGATIAALRERLDAEYPALRPLLPALVCAVRDEYVRDGFALSDGDEVALIPPVSGGEGVIEITSRPLDPGRLADSVRRSDAGGLVVFEGSVRSPNEGHEVLYLEYDAHESMALKKLREVADEARGRWPGVEMAIAHRTGRIEVGAVALVVAVSAPHREEAFAACQWAVDRIKEVVPIWKKEVWDGGAAWDAGMQAE